jgi:hypothetical protein
VIRDPTFLGLNTDHQGGGVDPAELERIGIA